MIYGIIAALVAILIGFFCFSRKDNRKIGAMEASQEGLKQEIDDVQKVKMARDSFFSNVAASSKLRDKYTRKP